MTVPNTTRRAGPFYGTGALVSYPFTFKVFAAADLAVTVADTDGVETDLVLDSSFLVTLNADQDATPGGSIQYAVGGVATALPTGYALVATGEGLEFTQPADLPQGGNFNPVNLENVLDRLVMQTQLLRDQLARVLQLSVTTGDGVAVSLPPPDAAAIIGWDGAGTALRNYALSDGVSIVGVSPDDLVSKVFVNKGAGMVGNSRSLAYAAGTVGSALQLAETAYNVLHAIPSTEWAAIAAGTSVMDVQSYIQAAVDANTNVFLPAGTYRVGSKITLPLRTRVIGQNEQTTIIKGTHAGVIFEFPVTAFDNHIEKVRFAGTGCTGIAVAAGGGPLQGYLIRTSVVDCHFGYEMAYGINADLIFGRVERCSFGYYGEGAVPAAGAGTLVGLRSYSVAANFTNVNVMRDCIFRAGSLTQAAIDISGGTNWLFENCDFETGGKVLTANNISNLVWRGGWVEGNSATNALFTFGSSLTQAVFDGINLANNTCGRIWEGNFSGGATRGLTVRNSFIGKAGATFCLFDTVLLSATLLGNGSVAFHDNYVTGGAAGDKIVTGTDFRGGQASPKLELVGSTIGGVATLVRSSDPGATLTYIGVGVVAVTTSHPIATATANIGAKCTPHTAWQHRVVRVSTTQVQVQMRDAAGAATESDFTLTLTGV